MEGMTSDTRPLRADAERNRQRILRAAGEVFAEHGLEASLDDVAHRAGVGVGTVYRRFPDKEALVEALFDERLAELLALGEECLRTPGPGGGLLGFLRRSCRLQAQNRGLRDVVLSSGFGQDRIAEHRDHLKPLAQRLIDQAVAAGTIRPDLHHTDLPILLIMIVAAADYTRDVAPEAWERFFTIVIDGLSGRRSPLPQPPLTSDQVEDAMRRFGPAPR